MIRYFDGLGAFIENKFKNVPLMRELCILSISAEKPYRIDLTTNNRTVELEFMGTFLIDTEFRDSLCRDLCDELKKISEIWSCRALVSRGTSISLLYMNKETRVTCEFSMIPRLGLLERDSILANLFEQVLPNILRERLSIRSA
jgi:hypothetical protein